MSEKSLVKRKLTTQQITITGMLSAISIVLGVTGLGYIPIPPFHTTIMHVPVIIGSLIEGPVVGAMLGLIFGLTSIFQAIKTPTPVSFIFLNPLVAVLPRILIGITPYYTYKVLSKLKLNSIKIALATGVGSFTNTIGVLGMIYILYFDAFVKVQGISVSAANKTFIALTLNGFVSAGAAILITLPVVQAVNKIKKN
ncbi:ECF transporter S component [Clostridium aestuarii]|uniref:ECF transporter S component n=1 Tax=Clostridium aestuarii TaxID=338193 RepID=A0ABT4CYZ8_9CLOT|nr:ECF transporter S component [Clostridium aestuarii]MCY6483350.1 ECF transporter S component [Clostridium aestuarii]